jgi:hypothetical protein
MVTISSGLARYLRIASAVGITLVAASYSPALAGGSQILDELRFGASASIQGGHAHEDGIFPEVTVFLDPFGLRDATDWKQQLARPRIDIGTSIGTQGEATQVFSGLSWKVNFTRKAFIEAGFGGVVHNGTTGETVDGPSLGCSLLFHEYVGLGYDLSRSWNVIGQVAHSSHANLCSGNNDGMTRAGLQLGYKF